MKIERRRAEHHIPHVLALDVDADALEGAADARAALVEVAESGDAQALPAVLALATDAREEVRWHAVLALRAIDDEPARAELARLAIREGLLEELGVADEVGIDWHGHRDRGMGLANCLAAYRAGATRVHGSALGIGDTGA